MVNVTLIEFMEEIQTWIEFTPEQLEKARNSGISTENSRPLKRLASKWVLGEYDEDLEALKQDLTNLIPK